MAQTDTTIGLLSLDPSVLNVIKGREVDKKVLSEISSLDALKERVRIPNFVKNKIRRSKITTFIYNNQEAFRLVNDMHHVKFLKKFCMMYSSSANQTSKGFCLNWAYKNSDVVVYDFRDFSEKQASRIYQIKRRKMKKIR